MACAMQFNMVSPETEAMLSKKMYRLLSWGDAGERVEG